MATVEDLVSFYFSFLYIIISLLQQLLGYIDRYNVNSWMSFPAFHI